MEESAEVAASLSHPQDAYKFLEKAVVLCVTNKYGNILALLLKLKDKYVKCGMKKKAMMLLRKYLVVVADFGQRVTMLFELGKLELQEGLVSNAISHIVEAREACQDKVSVLFASLYENLSMGENCYVETFDSTNSTD